MVTLAKALGGGTADGRDRHERGGVAAVEDGTVYQVGTYNGNPLGMAATRANLLEVLDARGLRSTSTTSTTGC